MPVQSAAEKQGFCFPLRNLENNRVLLSVFDPTIHGAQYISALAPDAISIHRYLPTPPITTLTDFLATFYEPLIVADPNSCLFAIHDKATSAFTGTIGLLNSSAQHLKSEIGYIIIAPSFRGTHVASNAIGLLMQYTLDLPERGGLGLRRLQWQSNERNKASVRVAEKMGFKKEGVVRWDRVVVGHIERGGDSETVERRNGDPRAELGGRHSVMLGMCWDEWEGGGRERASEVMGRTRS
ncbi:acyl-CoA N-acyltransferase [Pterulicium gracile]|uniref:Acyl-CoA N-acyltransferase n=1 Tax=Pterulicium gracile TaxID=1884261 RepID=A0A5C3Q603_9AGAR|nr:acyl-CoA N-acyltransferase [Pterula gracilis]